MIFKKKELWSVPSAMLFHLQGMEEAFNNDEFADFGKHYGKLQMMIEGLREEFPNTHVGAKPDPDYESEHPGACDRILANDGFGNLHEFVKPPTDGVPVLGEPTTDASKDKFVEVELAEVCSQCNGNGKVEDLLKGFPYMKDCPLCKCHGGSA